MEEKTEFLRLYEELCEAEKMFVDVIDEMRGGIIADCLKQLCPYENDEDIKKALLQTYKPISKYRQNIENQ